MANRSQLHQNRMGRAPASGEGVIVVAGPNISGNAVQGQTLTRVAPTLRGFVGTTIAYQWFRGRTAIGGATGNTYLVAAPDVGQRITLRAVLTNPKAPVQTLYSPATKIVT